MTNRFMVLIDKLTTKTTKSCSNNCDSFLSLKSNHHLPDGTLPTTTTEDVTMGLKEENLNQNSLISLWADVGRAPASVVGA